MRLCSARDWTREWLRTRARASLNAKEGLNNSDPEEQGFASRLYSLCLLLLRQLCRRKESGQLPGASVSSLKEELDKLYLWGEAFGDGELDRALEYSGDVRVNVLDSLRDIGKLLLRGMAKYF